MRTALIFGALVLAAVGAVWFVHDAKSAKKRENASLDQRLAALESRVSASPKVVRVVQPATVSVEVPSVQESPAPEGSAEAEAAEVPAQPAAPDDFSASNRRLWQAMADDFESESIDAGWARAARSEYLAPVQKLLPPSSELVSFECRSKFCRLEVVHQEMRTHNSYMDDLFSLEKRGPLVAAASGFRSAGPFPTADGRHRFEIYVAGRGVSLALAEAD